MPKEDHDNQEESRSVEEDAADRTPTSPPSDLEDTSLTPATGDTNIPGAVGDSGGDARGTSVAQEDSASLGTTQGDRSLKQQGTSTGAGDLQDGPASSSSSGMAAPQSVTPKDVVVTLTPSGAKMGKVVSSAVTAVPGTGDNGVSSNNNNINHNHSIINNNNNHHKSSSSEADITGGAKAVSNVCVSKKVLLLMLLALVIVVGAAVAIMLTVDGIKSKGSGQDGGAWGNQTHPLTGGLGGQSQLVTTTTAATTTTQAATTTSPSTTTMTEPTTSASTTPQSHCEAGFFSCSNSVCLPLNKVCDGVPDCDDGGDEGTSCKCTQDQFTCENGQCVPLQSVCNAQYECLDNSDEFNCSGCPFHCKSRMCVWAPWRRCNGIFDCDDLSDEMDCPVTSNQMLCSNGVTIAKKMLCDGVDNCGDNSDENNCSECPGDGQFLCSESGGRCIPATWRCDGHQDCDNGRDEQNCDSCTAEQFVCADYSCIDLSLRCDMKEDCGQHGGDEDNCLIFSMATSNSPVMVRGPGTVTPVPICAEGWSDTLADQACSLKDASSLDFWEVVRKYNIDEAMAVVEKPNSSAPLMSNLKSVSECQHDKVVLLSCKHQACGERKTEVLESLIISGGLTPPGKWPWVVSLAYLGKSICTGVVIGRRWVLTAAHCILSAHGGKPDTKYTLVPFYFTVTAGVTDISASSSSTTTTTDPDKHTGSQIFRVVNISLQPKAEILKGGAVNWDLAVLELDTAGVREAAASSTTGGEGTGGGGLVFSDLVQPICLPSPGEEFPTSSHCYIAGWGLINGWHYQTAHHLRDARSTVWSAARCRSLRVDTVSTLCGGFTNSRMPAACKGDSGGPLMCLDQRSGRYKLAGLVSQGGGGCSGRPHLTKFARVSTSTDWIQQVMRGS